MKKLIFFLLIFSLKLHAENETAIPTKPAVLQPETLAQKVNQFENENPNAMHILTAFLKESELYQPVHLKDMTIQMRDYADSNFIQLVSSFRWSSAILEAENEVTTKTKLLRVMEERFIEATEKPIEKYTKCFRTADRMYHCTSYIPNDIFRSMQKRITEEKTK